MVIPKRGEDLIADILAGKPLNCGINDTGNQTAQPAPQSATDAPRYCANLMKKLDLHETAGLVRHAIRVGLIQP